MCENCMYLEFDPELNIDVCTIDFAMDEDDLAKMAYHPRKRCPYYKIGDEYTIVRKQN